MYKFKFDLHLARTAKDIFTLDNRFQVNRQSIGSHYNRTPIVGISIGTLGSLLRATMRIDWHLQ